MESMSTEETTLPEAGLDSRPSRPRSAQGPWEGDTERPPPLASETDSLAGVALPAMSAAVQLASGRKVTLESHPDGDRLTVRARKGQVVLRVTLTDDGPVLAFEAAEVQLTGTRALRLDAESIEVSTGSLRTYVGGDVETRVTGARHTRIDGAEHLEAASLQAQANTGSLDLRAAGRIALDGEHIGLNDDPCPAPFPWTALAEEETDR